MNTKTQPLIDVDCLLFLVSCTCRCISELWALYIPGIRGGGPLCLTGVTAWNHNNLPWLVEWTDVSFRGTETQFLPLIPGAIWNASFYKQTLQIPQLIPSSWPCQTVRDPSTADHATRNLHINSITLESQAWQDMGVLPSLPKDNRGQIQNWIRSLEGISDRLHATWDICR